MTIALYNAIAANLKRQFPAAGDAFLLQKTTEIYQAMLNHSIAAAKINQKTWQQIRQERQQPPTEPQRQLPSSGSSLDDFINDLLGRRP